MADVTVVRFSFEGEKFEILVKPDPALEYKLGKKKDISAVWFQKISILILGKAQNLQLKNYSKHSKLKILLKLQTFH